MREHNSSLLFTLIWRESEISRADLARRTGLSRSTVSDIVEELLVSELIRESGSGDSRGGRPPTLLRFNDQAYLMAGIELGASHVSVVTTDLRGRLRANHRRNHPVVEQPDSSLELIDELLGLCLEGEPPGRLLGIGVAAPCPVHLDRPGQLDPQLMPLWREVDLLAELRRTHSCPVYLDNDANLGALAERWWGAGRGGQDLAYLKIATGVGAGLILNGDIYRGAKGTAGEIGHIAIDPRGPRCRCGLYGCLGAMVGSQRLLERLDEEIRRGVGTPLSQVEPTIEDMVTAAREGDSLSRRLIAEAGSYLGIAVAGLLNLLNPGVVVLGGSLADAGDILLDPIRDTLQHRTLWRSVTEARILTSELGDAAIAVGAATLVLRHALEDQSLFPNRMRVAAG
jgi:predicted NBD/HSP70 family sugar kinase